MIFHFFVICKLSLTSFATINRGFSGGYVREYIEHSNPTFAIGEYWDSLAYEGGNLCYNQGKTFSEHYLRPTADTVLVWMYIEYIAYKASFSHICLY